MARIVNSSKSNKFSKGSKIPIKQAESNTLWFLIVKITRRCKFLCFNEKISSNFTFSNYTRYKDYILVEYDSFFEKNFQKMRELNENQL